MATATELAGLMIRITGDDKKYRQTLVSVEKKTRAAVQRIQKREIRIKVNPNPAIKALQRVDKAGVKVFANSQKRVMKVKADAKPFIDTMKQVEQQAKKTTDNVGKKFGGLSNKMGNAMKNAGKGMMMAGATMTAGITLPVIGMMKLAANLETTKIQFETMLGADKGREMLKNLRNFSKVTPFRFEGVAGAGRTLLAFGMEQENVMENLQMLGDVAAGTGKDFKELAVIFGQIRGMGRLQGQDFLQLVNAGFPVIEIAKAIGTDMAGLKKKMEKGLVPFAAVQKAFKNVTSEGGRFNNMMERLSQTAAGKFSTAMDNLVMVGQEIGGVLLPPFVDFLEVVMDMVKWFQGLSKGTKEIIGQLAGFLAILGPILIVLGGLLVAIGSVVNALVILKGVTLAAAAGFAILAIKILIVAAAVYALIKAGSALINWYYDVEANNKKLAKMAEPIKKQTILEQDLARIRKESERARMAGEMGRVKEMEELMASKNEEIDMLNKRAKKLEASGGKIKGAGKGLSTKITSAQEFSGSIDVKALATSGVATREERQLQETKTQTNLLRSIAGDLKKQQVAVAG